MKLIAKLTVLALLLIPLLFGGMLALVVDCQPILQARADLTPERIAHGKRVFDQYDPRRLKSGAITKVSLSQDDLDLAINYFANQFLAGVAGVEIGNGRARIEGTWKLPANPLSGFLNVKLELRQADKLPQIGPVLEWANLLSAASHGQRKSRV